MTIDYQRIKDSVDIVDIIGKFVELKRQGSGFKGLCPFHDEKTPSFNVMAEGQFYKCHGGCGASGDVFDFLKEFKSFSDTEAAEYLTGDIDPTQKPTKREKPKKKKPAKPVPLSYGAAKDHYTRPIMQERADYVLNKDPEAEPHIFKEAWPFKNSDGDVELVAARFETESGHKTVLSMYWNGKTIKLAGYPVLLFNRDLLAAHPEKPVLIVEGEKSAAAAEVLTDFVSVTWNGGHAKSKDVDWSPLKNREVFIYPDDDQQKYKGTHPKAGQVMPENQQPGIKTAAQIKKKLPHAKIVTPLPAAREIKPSGADIVEALECMAVDELTAYILDTKGDKQADIPNAENATSGDIATTQLDKEADKQHNIPSIYPFKILGVADDAKAYIIGSNDRLYPFNPMSFTKAQLYNLADIEYWQGAYEHYGTGGKMWDQAISDLVQAVNVADFDTDLMRGRGAWREDDGRICYHDGRKTIGEYSKDRIYLRRPQKKIGLGKKHPSPAVRMEIYKAASKLTFLTVADCIRTLAWSVLAPFAGALPWRPAIMLTAQSGAGKSAVIDTLVMKLSKSEICTGEESTAAGVRQSIGVDSCSMVIEEAEKNRDEYFSIMRQSTTDNSPNALKGTIDGRGMKFRMRSMFMFVSIDPTVTKEGDENRIFRVELAKGRHNRRQWAEIEKNMKDILTSENCEGIRSFTWDNLPAILKMADDITPEVQVKSGLDNRTAYAESILLAALLVVFKNKLTVEQTELESFLDDFYGLKPVEQRRNENEEMVDIILDAIVRDGSASYSVRELLNAIETGFVWSNFEDQEEGAEREEQPMPSHYARQLVGRYGVGLSPCKNIAIAKNHQGVMNMLDKGSGYHQQLVRHPRLVERSKNVSLGSNNTRGCVVIGWERDDD